MNVTKTKMLIINGKVNLGMLQTKLIKQFTSSRATNLKVGKEKTNKTAYKAVVRLITEHIQTYPATDCDSLAAMTSKPWRMTKAEQQLES